MDDALDLAVLERATTEFSERPACFLSVSIIEDEQAGGTLELTGSNLHRESLEAVPDSHELLEVDHLGHISGTTPVTSVLGMLLMSLLGLPDDFFLRRGSHVDRCTGLLKDLHERERRCLCG